jgi:Fic family protein
MIGASGTDANVERELDALLQNVITSSAIEGEQLSVGSVRSSLAKRLGLTCDERVTARSEGLAELMLDAIQQHDAPLTFERLMHWHRLLLSEPSALTAYPIRVGMLRGPEPMQVVSGRIDRPVVHFEAPAREGLEQKLDGFFY